MELGSAEGGLTIVVEKTVALVREAQHDVVEPLARELHHLCEVVVVDRPGVTGLGVEEPPTSQQLERLP